MCANGAPSHGVPAYAHEWRYPRKGLYEVTTTDGMSSERLRPDSAPRQFNLRHAPTLWMLTVTTPFLPTIWCVWFRAHSPTSNLEFDSRHCSFIFLTRCTTWTIVLLFPQMRLEVEWDWEAQNFASNL